MKQKLRELKGEVDKYTILVGYFKTHHKVIDKSSRQNK